MLNSKTMYKNSKTMYKKRSTTVWLSVIAIALLSVILSFYTKNSNTTTSYSSSTFKSTSIKSVFNQSGVFEFFPLINQLFERFDGRLICNETKWKSPLIQRYGVGLILTVDHKGCGKFNSFQKAVDFVPENALKPTLIILDAGIYREKVNISKSNLIVQGQGYQNTFIVWNTTAADIGNDTFHTFTVGVFAPKFIAHDISFKNTAPIPHQNQRNGQAVAFRIGGDQAAFYRCGFYGFQDTLHDDAGRHYFKHCFIEGAIDFIFGNGRSLYEDCTLNSVAISSWSGINGIVAAQKRESLQEKTGFSFVRCKITGTGNTLLGRAWGMYSTAVYINTFMPGIINPGGWNDWDDPSKDQKVFFGEHACSGPGSNFEGRVKYAKQLNATDASPYMDIAYIDGKDWLR